jgi:very-short-patch-repair endonuclease
VPVPNQRILDEHGGFVAIGDLVYDEWLIVIEYDGAHHRDPLRQAKDATRRTRLREIGFYVVELTADDVRWPERALGKIRAALLARGVDLSSIAA